MTTKDLPPEILTLGAELKKPGRSQADLAKVLGFPDASYVNKIVRGTRGVKAHEMDKIRGYLAQTDGSSGVAHIGNTPDLPDDDPRIDYVAIEVLPTHAGMGGGGTGDGDGQTALVPRSLVTHDLRAEPSDLLLINCRGDSMFDPATGRGFLHGDQILIDRRDTNPRQPGAFALWFDDGYVVKNVEIIRKTGTLRIFSNNPIYSDDEADPEEVTIMGRPVWFARRL